MPLTLTIENETALMDGGPLTYAVSGKRGFDIGRDSHLDWALPDPSRYISSKHCEVRYRDNGFWLHDVSTNGTFLNGSDRRMSEPHRLRDGDRIAIGHYLIRVALDGEAARPAQARHSGRGPALTAGDAPHVDDWSLEPRQPRNPLYPIDSRMPLSSGPGLASTGGGDFLDWMTDLPPMLPDVPATRPARAPREIPARDEWSQPAPPVPPLAPGPRRGSELIRPEPDAAWWDEPAGPARAPRDSPPAPPSPPVPAQPLPRSAPGPAPVHGPPAVAPLAPEPAPGSDDRAFIRAFATAAGLPESALDHHDAASLAHLLGGFVRLTVDDLRQLLAARFEAKRMARSSVQTQISGTDNNPLKFTPTIEDSLKLMFGPPSRSYLDAQRTLDASFADIKSHQLETYAAMQSAVLELTDDFDPKKIDAAAGRDSALGHLVGSRKARAWDIFVARWEAKALRRDNGILGAFMEYFSKNYDRGK